MYETRVFVGMPPTFRSDIELVPERTRAPDVKICASVPMPKRQLRDSNGRRSISWKILLGAASNALSFNSRNSKSSQTESLLSPDI